MDRNNVILKIFEYWRSNLKGRQLPSRSDIRPRELRELLPFLFVADVTTITSTRCEINLRLVGTHIERSLGFDLTGFPVGGMAKHWQDFAIGRDFFDAVKQRCAIVATHELRGATSPEKFLPQQTSAAFLRYHRLVLPLSCDGLRVDRLFGALIAEVHENVWAMWQAPFAYEEKARKLLTYPTSPPNAKSIASPARRVPV